MLPLAGVGPSVVIGAIALHRGYHPLKINSLFASKYQRIRLFAVGSFCAILKVPASFRDPSLDENARRPFQEKIGRIFGLGGCRQDCSFDGGSVRIQRKPLAANGQLEQTSWVFLLVRPSPQVAGCGVN